MVNIQTKRLSVRALSQDDFDLLFPFLSDPKTMYAYEHGFSREEVQALLDKQIHSYAVNNFGLWAVILKETKTCIGLCGVTLQYYNKKTVPELGYIFHKTYWHNGYAFESASACMDFAFSELNIPKCYAIIRDTNHASQKLALRLGMKQVDTVIKHYWQMDMPHLVFVKDNTEEPFKPAS